MTLIHDIFVKSWANVISLSEIFTNNHYFYFPKDQLI